MGARQARAVVISRKKRNSRNLEENYRVARKARESKKHRKDIDSCFYDKEESLCVMGLNNEFS